MSIVKQLAGNCACHQNMKESGSMSLSVVPAPKVAGHPKLDEVKSFANELQETYFSHMSDISTNEYMDSHHAHATLGPSHAELPQMMTESGLTMRVSHTDKNDHIVCAEVSPAALSDVLRDGIVTVEAPMNLGAFRLHSGKPGMLTGVEFLSRGI